MLEWMRLKLVEWTLRSGGRSSCLRRGASISFFLLLLPELIVLQLLMLLRVFLVLMDLLVLA